MQKKQSQTTVLSLETGSNLSSNASTIEWKTTAPERNESIAIHDVILYISSLVILCAISFGRTSESVYYLTNMLMKAFFIAKTDDGNAFNDIAQNNGEDLWKSLQGPIFSRLYNTEKTPSNAPSDEYGHIYTENIILGVARLRQLRVKSNSCQLHHEFAKRSFLQGCYADFSTDAEDQSSFGNDTWTILTSKAWQYTSAKELQTSTHTGLVSNYGGGGYVQLFSRNGHTTREILQELKKNAWVNRGTRAIFFDLLVFNPNANLFSHVRLLAEYPPSGGAVPSTSIRAVKLIRYTSPIDYATLVCEIIFILIVILQIVDFAFELLEKKLSFLSNLWNLLNLCTIILSIVCILYGILVHHSTNQHLETLLHIENEYPNFDQLFTLKINSDFYLGITLALNWSKIFKYLKLNSTLFLLNKTISTCSHQLLAFACIFLIIFLAYAELGWLLFGGHLSEWRSFRASIFTLFRMIVGDFDFYALMRIGSVIGPLFLFTYIYFVYFVLLNMFLAIINEAYSRIESDSTLQRWQIQFLPMSFLRCWSGEKPVDRSTDATHEKNKVHSKTILPRSATASKERPDGDSSEVTDKVSYDDYLELDRQVDEVDQQLSAYVSRIEQILIGLDTAR